MQELFEYTGVDLHIYTVDINSFESVDISHKSHPNWRVIEAVYVSSSLPFIFKPFLKEGTSNNPLDEFPTTPSTILRHE